MPESRQTTKRLRILAGISLGLYVLSLVPILAGAFYAHPVADDYSFSYLTYQALQRGEGAGGVLCAAMQEVQNIYHSWQGTYAAIFLFSLQPGIYGSQYYWLTTVLILVCVSGGTFLLLQTLMKPVLPSYSAVACILSCALLLTQIQFLPFAAEGLFWYNGAVYYSVFYGLLLIFLALLFPYFRSPGNSGGRSSVPESGKKEKTGKTTKEDNREKTIEAVIVKKSGLAGKLHAVVLLLLALVISGGNYTTALLGIEILTLILLYGVLCHFDKRKILLLAVLLVSWAAGLAVNILAPGNAVRGSQMQGMSAGRAVLSALTQAGTMLVEWIRLPQLAVLLVAVPAAWLVAEEWKETLLRRFVQRWKSVLLVAAGMAAAFGLFASQLVPALYAMSDLGAGRQRNIYYYSSLWLLLFLEVCVGVVIKVISRKDGEEEGGRNQPQRMSLSKSFHRPGRMALPNEGLFLFVALWIAGAGVKGFGSTTSGIVTKEYISGSLQSYREGWQKIDKLLEEASRDRVTSITLPAVPETPACFSASDLSAENPDSWESHALARYYGLEAVTFVRRQ